MDNQVVKGAVYLDHVVQNCIGWNITNTVYYN